MHAYQGGWEQRRGTGEAQPSFHAFSVHHRLLKYQRRLNWRLPLSETKQAKRFVITVTRTHNKTKQDISAINHHHIWALVGICMRTMMRYVAHFTTNFHALPRDILWRSEAQRSSVGRPHDIGQGLGKSSAASLVRRIFSIGSAHHKGSGHQN